MSLSRKVFSVLGVVLLLELAIEFYLIAAAAFSVWGASDDANSVYSAFKSGDNYTTLHGFIGTLLVPITIVLMLVVAFRASLSRDQKFLTAGILGLMAIQFLLGRLALAGGPAALLIGALHGIDALAIVGASAALVTRTWAFAAESR